MKATGYNQADPITAPDALVEFETATPELGPRDLLVEVRGISINPVDVKVRANMAPENGTRVLGFDAAGVVRNVGSDVSTFRVGDEVFYAGDITRPGTNSELHAVDERIVGRKPKSLGFAEAAGFPLTSITAWARWLSLIRKANSGMVAPLDFQSSNNSRENENMTNLTIVANIKAKANKIDLVKAELEKLIDITRAEEGCVQYDLHQDNENPAHFLFFENWESRELWQQHMDARHLQDYMSATDGAVEGFTLNEMTRVA